MNKHGDFTSTVQEYVARVDRWSREIGPPDWSAAQDYMCEPFVLAKLGRTVRQHQEMTISRFLQLVELCPDGHWVPVVQGWEPGEYLRHIDDYAKAGVDLRSLPLVGVGSTCRRQGSRSAGAIYELLHREGLRLHGFGVSLAGIKRYHELLTSADSMAWSSAARHESADPGWSANQLEIAELYRDRIEAAIDGDEQAAAERWKEAMTWTRERAA